MSDPSENGPVRRTVCGEIVGVYEPATFATPDGRCVLGSLLAVSPTGGSELQVAHVNCWSRTSPTAA